MARAAAPMTATNEAPILAAAPSDGGGMFGGRGVVVFCAGGTGTPLGASVGMTTVWDQVGWG